MKKILLSMALACGAFFNSNAQSLDFSSGNYLFVNQTAAVRNLGLTGFTLEAWVNPGSTSGALSIFRKTGDYNLYLNNGVLGVEVWSGGEGVAASWKLINGTNVVPANTWSHIAAVWDGANCFLYINGVSDASNMISGSVGGTENLCIGRSLTYGNDFFGKMDEVRIWNVAHSQVQIRNNMNCTFSTPQAGLVANYNFNQGTPGADNTTITTITDASGLGHDGVLTNFIMDGSASNLVADADVSIVSINITSDITSMPQPGTTVNFMATTVNEGFSPTYQWLKNGVIIPAANSTTYMSNTLTPSDTISCMVTNSSTCLSNPQATSNTIVTPYWDNASLDFDGINDYVVIPASTNINNQFAANTITIEGWYYIRALNNGSPMLIGESYLGDGTVKFAIYQAGNTITGGFHDFTWHQTPGVTPPLNQWVHIACTYDQTTLKMYFNGALVSSIAETSVLPNGTEEWRIGNRWDFPELYNGKMDEVRIWNIARTQAEIQNSMGCSIMGTQPGLVASYNFNVGVPNGNNANLTTLADSSGNAINATLNNFALNNTTSNWTTDANISAVSVTINANPTSIPSGSNANVTFISSVRNGGDGVSYQWLLNGAAIPGATASTYSSNSLTLTDAITCTITSNASCVANTQDTSNAVSITYWDNEASLAFDGNGDYVSVPIAVPQSETTYEFLFKTSDPNAGLFSVVAPGTGNDRDIYFQNGDLKVYVWDGGGPNETISTTGTSYADGSWHHLAYVIGASVSGQHLYIDGALVASGNMTSSAFNWNSHLYLGYSGFGSNAFLTGQMDEVRIWNVVRTPAQIQMYMNCSIDGARPNLMGNYNFNEGDINNNNYGVDTLLDMSGNAAAGTLNNFTLNGTVSNWTTGAAAYTVPSVTFSGPSAVCAGNSATLSVSGSATSYMWSANAGSSTNDSITVTPTDTMTLVINISNGTCAVIANDSITVTVNELPMVSADSVIMCANAASAVLTANGSGGLAPYTFLWNNFLTAQTINAGTGSYTVEITDDNGCVNSDTTSISTYPALVVTTSLSGLTITSNEVAATYQWLDCSNGFAMITDSTNQSYTAAVNGDYAVSVSANGCSDTSACVTINSVGINQIDLASKFNAFPNPAKGVLNLEFYGRSQEVTISLENSLGQTVYTSQTNQAKQAINVGGFQAGVYIIKVRSANETSTKLIIIE